MTGAHSRREADDQRAGVYRTRSQALVLLTVALSPAPFAASFLWTLSPGDTALLQLLVLEVMPAACMLLAGRASRARVRVRGSAVEIVNPLRTVLLDADAVERFVGGGSGMFPRVAIAQLKDGTEQHAFGIQGPNPMTRPNNRDAEDLVAALNVRLRQAQRNSSTRPGTTSARRPSAVA